MRHGGSSRARLKCMQGGRQSGVNRKTRDGTIDFVYWTTTTESTTLIEPGQTGSLWSANPTWWAGAGCSVGKVEAPGGTRFRHGGGLLSLPFPLRRGGDGRVGRRRQHSDLGTKRDIVDVRTGTTFKTYNGWVALNVFDFVPL